MSHQHDHNDHKHGHHEHPGGTPPRNRPIHHKWQFWVAVILMLSAMAYYVVSMDEAIVPGAGGKVGQEMPAAP